MMFFTKYHHLGCTITSTRIDRDDAVLYGIDTITVIYYILVAPCNQSNGFCA